MTLKVFTIFSHFFLLINRFQNINPTKWNVHSNYSWEKEIIDEYDAYINKFECIEFQKAYSG